MKRIIKNYETAEDHHLQLIAENFPDGFDPENLISMENAEGKIIKYLEVQGEEVIYLFRIDQKMINKLDDFTDDDFDLGDLEDYYNEEY